MNAEHGEQERSKKVAAWLAAAAPQPLREAEVKRAWSRLRLRLVPAPRPRRILGLRPAWLGVAATLALVGSLGFSSAARSATVRMLSWFRVTQITALPLDMSSHSPLGDRTTASLVQQMMADEITVTRDEKSSAASDGAAAAQAAGFALRYPANLEGLGAPQFRVQGGKDFSLRVDRARAQAILADAGLAGAQLPESLDGATIAVHVPRAVAMMYGDCKSWAASDRQHWPGPELGTHCTVLGEGPGPSVSVPPGLDIQKIAEVGLQLLGMSASEAQQYCQTIDWSSTLVVPFPRDQVDSRQVAVDGVSGILLTRNRPKEGSDYVLLWSRQGMLYSVQGAGDGSQGLSLAAQLPR